MDEPALACRGTACSRCVYVAPLSPTGCALARRHPQPRRAAGRCGGLHRRGCQCVPALYRCANNGVIPSTTTKKCSLVQRQFSRTARCGALLTLWGTVRTFHAHARSTRHSLPAPRDYVAGWAGLPWWSATPRGGASADAIQACRRTLARRRACSRSPPDLGDAVRYLSSRESHTV